MFGPGARHTSALPNMHCGYPFYTTPIQSFSDYIRHLCYGVSPEYFGQIYVYKYTCKYTYIHTYTPTYLIHTRVHTYIT
jgi:hypothetical protein